MSDRGLEDRWRIVIIGSTSQINGRDELRGEKEELNISLVLIPQLVYIIRSHRLGYQQLWLIQQAIRLSRIDL
jgi:hypothetical protein